MLLHVLSLKLLTAACIAKVTFNDLQAAHVQVVFQSVALDCPNLTSVGAQYWVVLALWPVFLTDNFIGGFEVTVHAGEVTLGTFVCNMSGQLIFLDLLATFLRTLHYWHETNGKGTLELCSHY